jgi:hypothetical protein
LTVIWAPSFYNTFSNKVIPDTDRYRAMATSLGFEGHMALAEAMI